MSEQATSNPPQARRLLVVLPLVIFLGLAGLFLLRLYGGDPSKIPSALIGRPAPQTALPALDGLEKDGAPVPGLDPAAFSAATNAARASASTTRTRRRMRGASSAATATRSASSASTATAAPRSNGVSTAYPKPSWSGARAPSSTSWSDR
jgi:hypothetical protein